MRLEDMRREDCEKQLAYARDHDPAAAMALETFMRHRFGAERRFEPKPAGALSRAEALAELGLGEGASSGDINRAYRQLIKAHHPDRGGIARPGRAAEPGQGPFGGLGNLRPFARYRCGAEGAVASGRRRAPVFPFAIDAWRLKISG